MTLDEQIAWIGKIQYWFQDAEDAPSLAAVKSSLRRLQELEAGGGDAGPEPEQAGKYQDFIAAYDEFCCAFIGVGAKIDGAQGKAMKSIMAYLAKQNKAKDEEGALAAWKYILKNWGKLTEFIRNQTALVQVNKNLQEILTQLRHAGKASGKNAAARVKGSVIRRRDGGDSN